MNYPGGVPPPTRSGRCMSAEEHPLDRLDRRHSELLEQIDQLGRQVEQVLEEYSSPSAETRA